MCGNVSVIVPTFNNSQTVKTTIQSVLMQKLDEPPDIIVVDDASTDNTVFLVESMGLKVTRNLQNLGLAASLNKGIRLSKSDFVVTLHGDTTPLNGDWLSQLTAPLVLGEADATCSLQHAPLCNGPTCSIWEKFLWGKLGPHHALNDKADGYQKETILKLGGFDEVRFRTAGEDEDMAFRLRLSMARIAPTRAEVRHDHRFDTKSKTRILEKILAKEYTFGRCGGALRRKFPTHRPGAYVYPAVKSTCSDGAFRVCLCIGALIPYLQLICIPGLVGVSLLGINSTKTNTRLGFRIILYPIFNIARFWSYTLGYLHGLVTGRQV